MTVQFIEIAGQRMAVLPAVDFDRLVEAAEDRADVDAAAAAEERRRDGETYLPAAEMDRILNGENSLKVWREYRGFTQNGLAERAGVTPPAISKLEAGSRGGKAQTWRALAAALGIAPADIMPIV